MTKAAPNNRRMMLAAPGPKDWRALRKRHALTQVDLARLVYRTVQAVRKWEQGQGGGDLACWHLALLLLGELDRKRNRMALRTEAEASGSSETLRAWPA